MRTIPKTCHCCGSSFMAGSNLAKWCSSRCTMRAYLRRRRGAPEADPGVHLISPRVVQAEILDDPDELPLPWSQAEPAISGLEVREWQGTPIERRTDGYVNATAMCKANGKRWAKFRESAQCEAYMQALAAEDRISVFALVDSQRGGIGAGGATWIHPDLATELARWISPAFSVFVNRWFRSVVESGQQSRPVALPPSPYPTLPAGPLVQQPGVVVFARTKKEAFRLWRSAVEGEVLSALSAKLNVACLTDSGMRVMDLRVPWHQVY